MLTAHYTVSLVNTLPKSQQMDTIKNKSNFKVTNPYIV